MHKLIATAIATVAAGAALVVPAGSAQAANNDTIVSFTAKGVIWACQTPENSIYGPIHRVIVTYQRAVKAPYGPYDGAPFAITNVMRKRNSTESVRVAQTFSDQNQWLGAQRNVAFHQIAASAVLGDRVEVQFSDGMYSFGKKSLVPANLKRC